MSRTVNTLLCCLFSLIYINASGQLTISKTLKPECNATKLTLKNTSRDTTYFIRDMPYVQENNCYYSDVWYSQSKTTIDLSSTAIWDIEKSHYTRLDPDSATLFILRNSMLTDSGTIGFITVRTIYAKRKKKHISRKQISKIHAEKRTFLF